MDEWTLLDVDRKWSFDYYYVMDSEVLENGGILLVSYILEIKGVEESRAT